MSNKKEAERAELHRTIWRIANDLRGSVDGWDFKSYVLGMLFYRFISENLTAYLNSQERSAGDASFDYAALPDAHAEQGRYETVKEKGFYILPSELFANVRERARHDANLNETLSRVFKDIEGSAIGTDSEADFKGLFDDLDVNSGKLGPTVARRNEKLVKLLDAIGDLNLGTYSENTIDAFGDAYEFLMTMYASSAGKSGGEFFTPKEIFYIDTVIQLPPDLFFGTTIATCVIVLKKSKHDNATVFIDASTEFVRSGNKNKLSESNQRRVLDAFTARRDVAHFARLVENGDIAANGYNIAVSSYVEQADTREAVDIRELNSEIARIVARQAELRVAIDVIVADLEGELA